MGAQRPDSDTTTNWPSNLRALQNPKPPHHIPHRHQSSWFQTSPVLTSAPTFRIISLVTWDVQYNGHLLPELPSKYFAFRQCWYNIVVDGLEEESQGESDGEMDVVGYDSEAEMIGDSGNGDSDDAGYTSF